MNKLILTVALSVLLTTTALADGKKLSNDTLKGYGWSRLEGNNPFKPGCRYIIRSQDKKSVYRPSVVQATAIGFAMSAGWQSVESGDKATLKNSAGGSDPVTTWRKCGTL